jgi:hypothetical protein
MSIKSPNFPSFVRDLVCRNTALLQCTVQWNDKPVADVSWSVNYTPPILRYYVFVLLDLLLYCLCGLWVWLSLVTSLLFTDVCFPAIEKDYAVYVQHNIQAFWIFVVENQ